MPVSLTGGNWNEADRYVYFLACGGGELDDLVVDGGLIHKHLLIAVNEINDSIEKRMAEAEALGAKWFIDSGIFHLTNEHMRAHGIRMDEALALAPDEIDGFGELFEKYIAVARRWQDRCWAYIELDQGGRENKIKTRARLESLGLRPMPVYHPFNDGWDYFDYLAERYDRICIGNVVQASARVRLRLLATIWQRKQKYPALWVHFLGLTPNQMLNAYPVDSGDSSTWLAANRWKGAREKAMLKTIGDLPDSLQYAVGNQEMRHKGISLSAVQSDVMVRFYRYHIEALGRYGCAPYPREVAG